MICKLLLSYYCNAFDNDEVCNLYLNTFTSYSPGYKPWVFHSSNNSEVVVVDPNLQQIFRIPLTDPDTFNSPGFQTISIGSRPVSVLFNRQTNKLYVGVSGQALMMKGCIHILLLFSIFYCWLAIPLCCYFHTLFITSYTPPSHL